MEIRQRLKIPELSSYNDLIINYDGSELLISSSNFDLKEIERNIVREICKEYNVSFDGRCFFIKLKDKNLDLKKLNDNIERIKSAIIEFVLKREKTEVFSVRLPIQLKSEIIRLAEKMEVSYPELIEKMFYTYKLTYPSLSEEKTERVIEKEEFQDIFRRIDNFKPADKKLGRIAKSIKRNFKGCALACSKFDKKKYYDLIVFFEKPRVNIHVNLRRWGSNVSINKRRRKDWEKIKEKAEEYGIKTWENMNSVSLYVPAKNTREIVRGIKKILKFLKKEKIKWGWWAKV